MSRKIKNIIIVFCLVGSAIIFYIMIRDTLRIKELDSKAPSYNNYQPYRPKPKK